MIALITSLETWNRVYDLASWTGISLGALASLCTVAHLIISRRADALKSKRDDEIRKGYEKSIAELHTKLPRRNITSVEREQFLNCLNSFQVKGCVTVAAVNDDESIEFARQLAELMEKGKWIITSDNTALDTEDYTGITLLGPQRFMHTSGDAHALILQNALSAIGYQPKTIRQNRPKDDRLILVVGHKQ